MTKIINLLPKDQLRQLQLRSWYGNLGQFYVLSVASFAVVALIAVGVWLYLTSAQRSLEAEAAGLQQQFARQENAELRKRIRDINNQISDYNTLAESAPAWSRVFREFAQVVPPGVFVQQFGVDSTKKQIIISGFAPTRELVVQLHDAIAADTDNFANIDYPLENVAKPSNVNFHFTFSVKDTLLAQQK